MKHNYSYAGIAVALKKDGCQLMACKRQVDRLEIVEVSVVNELPLKKGLWLRSFAQSPFLEGALDEADAAVYRLHEWWNKPGGQASYRKWERRDPDSPLNCWVRADGRMRLWFENGRYVLELASIGSMKPGWRVIRLQSRTRLHQLFTCANEIAALELAGSKTPELQVQVVAG